MNMNLTLSDFGSYYAGGGTTEISGKDKLKVQVTKELTLDYDPNGSFAVEQAYIQYFVPADRNNEAPVVLQHGGGLNGSCWETTPDGRAGWLTGLLLRGYEVHVVDNVERGRAGWIPNHWPGQPILRSMQDAWTLFRFGAAEDFDNRTPFEHQQFPVAHLETFARSFCPRWTSTSALQVAALIAVLERTGPATVISHSQGGEIAFDANTLRPDLFASMIAIEPSAAPQQPQTLRDIPVRIIHGDYLDRMTIGNAQPQHWQAMCDAINAVGGNAVVIDTARAIAPGASHMLMMDRNSDQQLAAAMAD